MFELKNFTITKREGTRDYFSFDKIMNAIVKAFEAVEEPFSVSVISKVASHLNITDDITIENIQNQCEIALMKEGYYKVAKCLVLYRQSRSHIHETLEKLNFLSSYMEGSPIKHNKLKNKAKIVGILKEHFEEEELETALNELAETENIDRRIFNGRKTEVKLCECITNDEMWDYIVKCYNRFISGEISVGSALSQFLEAFAVAYYEVIGKREPHHADGMTSAIYRLAKNKLGNILSFGVRTIQKRIANFREYMRYGKKLFESMSDKCKENAIRRTEAFAILVEKIKNYLLEQPALVLAN